MAMRERLFWVFLVIVLAGILFLLQCQPRISGEPAGTAVNLEPNDPRPVYQIMVADSSEVALLQQQLKLEVLRYEENRLYFYADEAVLARLPEYGYAITTANPHDVYYRVVRVSKRGERKALTRYGVHFINAEKDYWIVRGSIGALRGLQRAGYRLSPIGKDEPRPRPVRITVKSVADIQRVASLQVDIYSVTGVRKTGIDDPDAPYRDQKDREPIQVSGGAFDDQIEKLRELGFTVELLPTEEN